MVVTLDQAKITHVPEGTKTLVVGSPIVADVLLLKGSNTMVVTGKGYGQTNIIALDNSGNVLDEKMVRVEPTGSLLVVQRGMTPYDAQAGAYEVLANLVHRQAAALTFMDIYAVLAWVGVGTLLLLILFQRPRSGKPAVEAH